MVKFEVGDEVICIGNKMKENDIVRGAGWKKDLVFTITKIEDFVPSILWGGYNDCGVYEHSARLNKITNWRKQIENGKN